LEYTDVVSGELLWSRPVGGGLTPLAIEPDGHHALLYDFGSVQLWSLAEGLYVKDIFPAPRGPALIFALTPSCKVCAVPTLDRVSGHGLMAFEVASGKLVGKVKAPASPTSIALTPDGRRALYAMDPTVGVPNTVEFWDLPNRRLLKSYPCHTGDGPVAISADGKYAACYFWGRSLDGKGPEKWRLVVWETESGKEVARLDTGRGIVAFLPGGKTLAIDDPSEGSLRRVEWATGRVLSTFQYSKNDCRLKAISPDGRWVLFADYSGNGGRVVLGVGDLATGQLVRTLEGPHPGAH
jgi:WD40 repeat protein